MNFLFPTFLFGLAAIAIPVIIHLFNFRKYKKVYFTNVQFLKELKQESDSKSKLKEYLILACRILAITCLVMAFAQPFIPGKSKAAHGEKAISVYIDNSFSMENVNKKGSLLENAKQHAVEIASTYNASDRFQVITNDFEGRHQRFLSKDEFIEQVNDIKISPATRSIDEIIRRQQDFLQNSSSKNKRIFLISDFQKNISVFNKASIDTAVSITCIPVLSSEVSNVYIDSVWFESPVQQYGTSQIIHTSVINKSARDIENATLKLFINGRQVSMNSFNAASGEKKDIVINFTIRDNGLNQGALKIEDYPISYDDEFYFSFNAQATVHTLVINGKDTHTAGNFRSLMQNDSLFVFNESNEAAIDYALFPKLDMIVLNELNTLSSGLTAELQKFITSGGSLVIFPNEKADINSYNSTLQTLGLPAITAKDSSNTRTQTINFEQGLYEGVFEKNDQRMDMPKVFGYFTFKQSTSSGSETIISLQNGLPFLAQYKKQSGKIYLFATGSDEQSSNFVKHALFVPTLIKMAILSLKPHPLYYKTAINEAVGIEQENNFADKPLHIVNADKSTDVIPEHRLVNGQTFLFTQNQITRAGHYSITNGDAVLKGLAFNYDRRESDMQFETPEELQKQIVAGGFKNISVIETGEKSVSGSLLEANDGKKLWKLFLILALVFLLAEVAIIRLVK